MLLQQTVKPDLSSIFPFLRATQTVQQPVPTAADSPGPQADTAPPASAIPANSGPVTGSLYADPYLKQAAAQEKELERLEQTGSGISQIGKGAHGVEGAALTPVRWLASAGNAFGSALAPRLMAHVPGTSAHNSELINQAGSRVNNALGRARVASQADLAEQGAADDAAKPEEVAQKLDALQDRYDALNDQANKRYAAQQAIAAQKEKDYMAKLAVVYRRLGLDPQGNPIPDTALTQDELNKRKNEQGQLDLQQAHAENLEAQTALEKARQDALNNPNSPGYQLKLKQAETAAQNAKTKDVQLTYAQIRGILGGVRDAPEILSIPGLGLTSEQVTSIEQNLPRNPETGDVVGLNNQMAPSQQTRSRGQQAADIIPFVNKAVDLVQQDKEMLGPIQGRWTEFMSGKAGYNNPQYSNLRTALMLIKGAFTRFHMNNLLGYEHFEDVLNAAQSPDNLIASLNQISELAQLYKDAGEGYTNTTRPRTSGTFKGLTNGIAPNPGSKNNSVPSTAPSKKKSGPSNPFDGLTGGIKG